MMDKATHTALLAQAEAAAAVQTRSFSKELLLAIGIVVALVAAAFVIFAVSHGGFLIDPRYHLHHRHA